MDIQYVATVSPYKDKAAKLKAGVKWNKFLYLKKDCTWRNLKELVLRGCTVARVGGASEYIVLDIDESEVTHKEMADWAAKYNHINGDSVFAVPSASGKEFKHHVFFKMAPFHEEDHKEVLMKCFRILAEAFAGQKISLDKRAWGYYQCMYHTGNPGLFILDGSNQLDDWCRKGTDPILVADSVEWDGYEDNDDGGALYARTEAQPLIPNNAGRYFYMLRQAGYPFSLAATIPFSLIRPIHVKKGNRKTAMFKIIQCLVKNVAILQYLGGMYTVPDIITATEDHIVRHFEEGGQFLDEERDNMRALVKKIWEEFLMEFKKTPMEYTDLVKILGPGRHKVSLKAFALEWVKGREPAEKSLDDICIEIVDDWNGYPEDYHTGDFHKQLRTVRQAIKTCYRKKLWRFHRDMEEARRVYNASKEIHLFDDMSDTPKMEFEEFLKKSTAGRHIIIENGPPAERKAHRTHKNKGLCPEGCKLVGLDLIVPAGIPAARVRTLYNFCRRNQYNLVRGGTP